MEFQANTGQGITAAVVQSPAALQNGPLTPPLGGMQNTMLLQPSLGLDSITRGDVTGKAFKNASIPTVADVVKASLAGIAPADAAETMPPQAVDATQSPAATDATGRQLGADYDSTTSSASGNQGTPGQRLARFLSGSSASSNPLSQWQVSNQTPNQSAAIAQATTSQNAGLEQTQNGTQSAGVTQPGGSQTAVTPLSQWQVANQAPNQSAATEANQSAAPEQTQNGTQSAAVTQAEESQTAVSPLSRWQVSNQPPNQSAATAAAVAQQTVLTQQVASETTEMQIVPQAQSRDARQVGDTPSRASVQQEISNAGNGIRQVQRKLPYLEGNAKREAEAIRNGEMLESLEDPEDEPAEEPIRKQTDRLGLQNPYDPFQNSTLAPLARKGMGQAFAGLEALEGEPIEDEIFDDPFKANLNRRLSGAGANAPLAGKGMDQAFAGVWSIEDESFEDEAVAGAVGATDPFKSNNQKNWITAAASGRDGAAMPTQPQNPALTPFAQMGVEPAPAAVEEEAIVMEEVINEAELIVTSGSGVPIQGGSSPRAEAESIVPGFKAAQMAFQGALSVPEGRDDELTPEAVRKQASNAAQPGFSHEKSVLESAAELMAFINQPKPQDVGGPYYGAEATFGFRGRSRGRRGDGDDPHDQQRRERRNQVWAALAESRAEREREKNAKKEAEAAEKKTQRKKPNGEPSKKSWGKVPLTPKAPPPPRARLPKVW